MKRYIALFSFLALFLASITGSAQNSTSYHATFNYDQAMLDDAVKSKGVEFTLSNLSDEEVKELEKKAAVYSNMFDIKFSGTSDRLVKVSFKEKGEMKMLYRFFISANIKDVTCNNVKMPALDFFKAWM
jgi:hypothetical protein